ncbi:siderophore ABC transporter substrate-binding protein CdtB [Isoptericola halotolerans]|uniref:Iron complex transport system substrate-binding protein n=1 Tax=Isoptericola halotolerans TaxID=300560 RepID=A0ABX2AA68_9MICO|nr:iron-siderophore ABC transporter substrate-binding protein [Isoptericola halotolerans]NOV99080.1 iron complex transport system substrate-binding protein [Isoptericola halotolerans]
MRTARALVAALTVGLTLTACGTTDDPAGTAPGTDTETSAATGPVTVTDARGEEVVLPDGPAERVVALEWNQAEMVTTLGVDLIGMSDPAGYESWVGAGAPLRTDPEDVGVRREPSIEAVADLEPDLIIGASGSVPDEAMEQMERIAPVVVMGSADVSDPLGTVRDELATVATLLGKEAEAEALLDDLDETLAANAAKIEEAGLAGTPVVLTSPYAEGANLSIRMHGPRTAVHAVADEMGLTAAWEDPGDDAFGLSYTDLEGLTGLPDDTRFLYWGNDGDEEDVVEAEMAGNPLWEDLAFVADGEVHRAAVGIWAYGGPASMIAWSDDLVQILGA